MTQSLWTWKSPPSPDKNNRVVPAGRWWRSGFNREAGTRVFRRCFTRFHEAPSSRRRDAITDARIPPILFITFLSRFEHNLCHSNPCMETDIPTCAQEVFLIFLYSFLWSRAILNMPIDSLLITTSVQIELLSILWVRRCVKCTCIYNSGSHSFSSRVLSLYTVCIIVI